MKQVVIFGCGYLGSHMANYFQKLNWNVKVLGRKSIYTNTLASQIRFFDIDINNIEGIGEFINKNDFIIYAAGSINATNKYSDLLPDISNNYTAFVKLLDLFESKEIEKLIFLSSAGTVYGNTSSFACESDKLLPTNIYGLQKVYFENLITIKHHESDSFPYLILRVSNPYGGFQNPDKRQGIIPVLINKALNNEEFIFWGNTAAVRDFIYIDDFLEAVFRTTQLKGNEIINIGSGTETTISEVISIVEQRTGEEIQIVHKELGTKTIMNNRLKIDKLKRLTSYEPTTTLQDGITRMVNVILETKNREL